VTGKCRPADGIKTKLFRFLGFLIGRNFDIALLEYHRIMVIAFYVI
jgi:hypothetical protein